MIFGLPWTWVAGAVVVTFLAGFVGGCEHNKHIIDAYEAAGKAQELETQKTIQKHEKVAQEIKSDYETRISAIRAAYRVRPSGTGSMSSASQTSGGTDADTTYNVLAEQCTETTQQLVSLQDFIKETQ